MKLWASLPIISKRIKWRRVFFVALSSFLILSIGVAAYSFYKSTQKTKAAYTCDTSATPHICTITGEYTITATDNTFNDSILTLGDGTSNTLVTIYGHHDFASLTIKDKATLTHERLIPDRDFNTATGVLTDSARDKIIDIQVTGLLKLEGTGYISPVPGDRKYEKIDASYRGYPSFFTLRLPFLDPKSGSFDGYGYVVDVHHPGYGAAYRSGDDYPMGGGGGSAGRGGPGSSTGTAVEHRSNGHAYNIDSNYDSPDLYHGSAGGDVYRVNSEGNQGIVGGSGGGVIRIVTQNLQLDAESRITADGGSGSCGAIINRDHWDHCSGGGGGGTIYLDYSTLVSPSKLGVSVEGGLGHADTSTGDKSGQPGLVVTHGGDIVIADVPTPGVTPMITAAGGSTIQYDPVVSGGNVNLSGGAGGGGRVVIVHEGPQYSFRKTVTPSNVNPNDPVTVTLRISNNASGVFNLNDKVLNDGNGRFFTAVHGSVSATDSRGSALTTDCDFGLSDQEVTCTGVDPAVATITYQLRAPTN